VTVHPSVHLGPSPGPGERVRIEAVVLGPVGIEISSACSPTGPGIATWNSPRATGPPPGPASTASNSPRNSGLSRSRHLSSQCRKSRPRRTDRPESTGGEGLSSIAPIAPLCAAHQAHARRGPCSGYLHLNAQRIRIPWLRERLLLYALDSLPRAEPPGEPSEGS
jgi:hypothetical protein